ncbi:MAG TPA: acetyl-CoA carboxylase biotin carboxylase subunit [Chloroflexia bacterium]|nr:acetyl-CoA carboxylase biotin carboxylase subunit [Chloroflexia bacterium]
MPIRKILIANRGEIAVRVIRACRDLGIASVAVFSEADRNAQHVRLADEAYCIGPPPARDSYLRADVILETAQRAGADAIHPGYGFLSERAEFSAACRDAGIQFIGPPPEAIRLMGDKVAARQLAIANGVPVVPGTEAEVHEVAEAERIAKDIGYPVLLKAAAGGGGKGMRVVRAPGELEDAIRAASSEATSAFGYGGVYIEKYLEHVRHIEIQLLADSHGHCVHLGERECSIQRRHQKLIEESPSAVLDADTRARMGAVAVRAALAAGYVNAGTIEFLYTPEGQFYFLEMNTRLQVEHPVTELVTGLDLVQEQIRVANGEPLPFTQDDVQFRGHAIECRITAEDPDHNFMPSIGRIQAISEPSGPGVRVDSAIYPGAEVSIYYDPMVAKLICWGSDRAQAVRRMQRALDEYGIAGILTNLPYQRAVLASPEFAAADFDTGFVERFGTLGDHTDTLHKDDLTDMLVIAAAVAAHQAREQKAVQVTAGPDIDGSVDISRWRTAGRRMGLRG